jgi:hypothetical protein
MKTKLPIRHVPAITEPAIRARVHPSRGRGLGKEPVSISRDATTANGQSYAPLALPSQPSFRWLLPAWFLRPVPHCLRCPSTSCVDGTWRGWPRRNCLLVHVQEPSAPARPTNKSDETGLNATRPCATAPRPLSMRHSGSLDVCSEARAATLRIDEARSPQTGPEPCPTG